jgi:hypothetical protein
MISVKVDDAEEFYEFVVEKKLPERFGIRISKHRWSLMGRK